MYVTYAEYNRCTYRVYGCKYHIQSMIDVDAEYIESMSRVCREYIDVCNICRV